MGDNLKDLMPHHDNEVGVWMALDRVWMALDRVMRGKLLGDRFGT